MKKYLKLLSIAYMLIVLDVTLKAATFTSVSSGQWDKGATWGNSGNDDEGSGYPGALDNAIITTGKSVQIRSNGVIVYHLTINKGGILMHSNNRALTVLGNYTINGSHTGTGSSKVTLSGFSGNINGLGSISLGGGIHISTSRTILASANITIASDLNIIGSVSVTNNGTVILTNPNSIIGTSSSSTWINDVNSTLKAGNILLSSGTLVASAAGNTVNYYLTGAQNIKIPSGNIYHHLSLTGVGTKTLQGNITINGNVYINGATFNLASYDITVKGNWNNEGILTTGTRTVTFAGGSAQTLSNPSGETFYKLTMAKSAGSLTINTNVSVTNTLTLSGGIINAMANTLTLGSGTGSIGSLSHSSGYIKGKFKRWVNATGVNFLFPLGEVYNFYVPLILTFNNLTSGAIEIEFLSKLATNNGLPLVDNDTSVYNTFTFGYYNIVPQNGLSSNNYNLSISGLPAFPIRTSTRVLTRADSTSNWMANGINQAADVGNSMGRRKNISTLPVQCILADVVNCIAPTTSVLVGTSSACINSSVNYSVTDHPGSVYTWYITGGTPSGSGSSITVNWGDSAMVGQVIVSETNSCGTGIASILNVTLSPEAPAEISGKLFAPENTSAGNEETYSVDARPGYTYSWSISGGTIVSGAATSSVQVQWGSAGTGHIMVSATNGCGTAPLLDLPVSIYVVINSISNGLWNSASTWDCNCIPQATNNVRITNPNIVTFPNTAFTINHLIIDVGGTLNNATTRVLTVTGDLNLDGIYTGSNELILSGVGTIIDGSGDGINSGLISTSGSVTLNGGGKTISETSTLTRSGNLTIGAGVNVSNNGHFTVTGDIIGAAASSTWTNNDHSSLHIGGVPLSTGTLIAAAINNEVDYCGAGAQTIKLINYQNLTSSSSGARTLPSGVISISEVFTPGTNAYTITGNTLNFDSEDDQDIPAFTYNNIIFSGAGNKNAVGQLNIQGNWTNNSEFISNGETILLNGTTAQVMTGATTFDYLTINNAAGVSITSGIGNNQNISGVLTLSSGTLTTNNNLLLISDISSTGQIAGTGTGSLSGNLKVQRFIETSGWHYISAPFNGATLPVYDDVHDNVSITSRNFYFYNETLLGSDGWVSIPATSSTTQLTKMKGYALKFPSEETTIEMSGLYNHTGEASLTGITYSPSNPASSINDGWQLIGNPYPSYIDWTLVARPAGIKSDITYYNPAIGSNATYIPPGPGNVPAEASINGATQFIPSMQAFWIQTTATNQTLSIPNSARVTSPVPTASGLTSFWRKASVPYHILKLKVTCNSVSDETIVRFFEGATLEVDDFDALKINNDAPSPSLYSIVAGNNYGINSLPVSLLSDYTLPLTLEASAGGSYIISALALDNFDPSIDVILVDRLLNEFHDLRRDSNYAVSVVKGSNADRFYIQFKSSVITGTENKLGLPNIRIHGNGQQIVVYFDDIQSSEADAVVVYDLLGKEIYRTERVQTVPRAYNFEIPEVSEGIYLVKVICNKEIYTGKVYLGK